MNENEETAVYMRYLYAVHALSDTVKHTNLEETGKGRAYGGQPAISAPP